jgi:hypothetical protein
MSTREVMQLALDALKSAYWHDLWGNAEQAIEALRAELAKPEPVDIERLRIGHARYEAARRMNPRQWADAWHLNLTTGKPFDEIIDDLMPFLKGNKC